MLRQRLTYAVLLSALALGAGATRDAWAQGKAKAGAKAKGDKGKGGAKVDVAKLKADLESGDEGRISAALEEAEKSGDAAAAGPVEGLLKRGASADITVKAIEAAGALKQTSSSAVIAPYVRHRTEAVRRAAVKALIKTKGPDATQALRRALHSRDAQVRGIAATGLGSLSDKDSIPLLFKALSHKVPEAAAAIGQLCDAKQCEEFAALTGKHPFDVMSSGFDQILFRAEKDMPEDQKIRIIGRIRELGTKEAGKYLLDVQGRWPAEWSKRVKQAIDSAVKATGASGGDE